MLTLKRHRFAAAAATLAVTVIVALTTGSVGTGAPMDAMAETVSEETEAAASWLCDRHPAEAVFCGSAGHEGW